MATKHYTSRVFEFVKKYKLAIAVGIYCLVLFSGLGVFALRTIDKNNEINNLNKQTSSEGSNSSAANNADTSNSDATSPNGDKSAQQPKKGEVCSQRSIPYSTITKYDNTLEKGQTSTIRGYNGTEYYCTSSNGVKRITGTVPPLEGTYNIGTREPYTYTTPAPTSTPSTTPKYTQAEASSLAQHNCSVQLGNSGAGNSSAYQQCVSAYMRSYGY